MCRAGEVRSENQGEFLEPKPNSKVLRGTSELEMQEVRGVTLGAEGTVCSGIQTGQRAARSLLFLKAGGRWQVALERRDRTTF